MFLKDHMNHEIGGRLPCRTNPNMVYGSQTIVKRNLVLEGGCRVDILGRMLEESRMKVAIR